MKHALKLSLLVFVLSLACSPGALFPTPAPTVTPTPLPTSTPLPTATPLPRDTGWQPLGPGAAARSVLVETGLGQEQLSMVRLDPAVVTLRVRYTPGVAQPVSVWAQQTGAWLVVNAGYFTEDALVTGLTISDGAVYGTAYGDFAGMLSILPEGAVSLRWMREQPYVPGEPLAQAVQSFPLLVKPGGVMGFPADADDGRAARRLVVAQDVHGQLLFVIAPRGLFSLHELAVWLAESDLEVDVALNLDGGPSAGLWLSEDASPVQVDSYAGVPAVITVDWR